MRRLARVAALALAAGLGLSGLGLAGAGVGVPPASAHDFLVSTAPAADSTVTEAITEVSATFNEPPLAELGGGIALEVRDPSGTAVSSGEVSIVDSTLAIAVAPTTAGAYTVLWQTVSSDGHPVSGEFGFDYQGPLPTATATASPAATTPAATTPAATQTPEASATVPATATAGTPSPTAAPASTSPLIWVGIAAAVVLLGAVAVTVVLTLRRRSSGGTGGL